MHKLDYNSEFSAAATVIDCRLESFLPSQSELSVYFQFR